MLAEEYKSPDPSPPQQMSNDDNTSCSSSTSSTSSTSFAQRSRNELDSTRHMQGLPSPLFTPREIPQPRVFCFFLRPLHKRNSLNPPGAPQRSTKFKWGIFTAAPLSSAFSESAAPRRTQSCARSTSPQKAELRFTSFMALRLTNGPEPISSKGLHSDRTRLKSLDSIALNCSLIARRRAMSDLSHSITPANKSVPPETG
mmetsp:Transcript_36945/g.73187  ORF Transcript_36945/g.73187 Transcript_36945/m.73187 type:complete len:200 (-) Transcript_36945:121-720(-)